ncbi:MAG: hypothetical protein JWL81_1457 [Verrucomicrobiales bacterium]|nr:hypothetical protein [Verrucomicrobiales bacterium]
MTGKHSLPRLWLPALILLMCCRLTLRAQDAAWLSPEWMQDVTLPAGAYDGGGRQVHVGKFKVSWEEGSLVENLQFRMEGEAQFSATRCHFRRLGVGLTLWARMDLTDCVVEGANFQKINPWFDTSKPSTKWRFNNCVIAGSFMGDKFTVVDCSVRAMNCTFLDMKMPVIWYRDNDVVNQARQDWLKFEKCRFVNCEVSEELLVASIDCVFENCRYAGSHKSFIATIKTPWAVTAYWSGRTVPGYEDGNLKVTFPSTIPNFKAGSTLAYTLKGKQLVMTGVQPAGPAVAVASQQPPAAPPAPDKPKPETPAAPVAPNEKISGTSGASAVPLPKKSSAVNALLVIDLPGQGVAGAAAKLSAVALPIDPLASTEVGFNQVVGPMMHAALKEVVKCLQIRYQGWPRGQKIELAFADKFVPKDGPSAAVACALLLDSMLGDYELDPGLAITGDLNADGSVQPIGGVSGKIRGATKAKCRRVAVPAKNESAVGDVLVLEGPEPLVRIEVFSIDTFDSAKALARKLPETEAGKAEQLFSSDPAVAPNLAQAGLLFDDARRLLLPGGKFDNNLLRDRTVQAKLREILKLQPNHLSAKFLLAAAAGVLPVKLSLQGSIDAMDDAAESLLQAIQSKEVGDMTKVAHDDLGKAVFKLKGSRSRMDPRIHPALDALTIFGQELRTWQDSPPRTQARAEKMAAVLMAAAAEANRQRSVLMNNRDVVEELMK